MKVRYRPCLRLNVISFLANLRSLNAFTCKEEIQLYISKLKSLVVLNGSKINRKLNRNDEKSKSTNEIPLALSCIKQIHSKRSTLFFVKKAEKIMA